MISLKNGEYTYSYSDLLGTGSFGSVFKCKKKFHDEPYALKIVEKRKLNAHGEYLHKALEREIQTQKLATESGIPFYVGLIESFEDAKHIYIVLEYCERSLMDFLAEKKLTEHQCLELVFQVALGLNYLHSIHITHRDIKPDNILIKDGILKIADFGFASDSSQLMTNLGTAPYMSPELFLDGDEAYSAKVDVWALNTCLYRLLTGKFYFWSQNRIQMEKMIKTKEFVVGPELANISDTTKDLLVKGYIKDPAHRLSMEEYVYHDAFTFLRKKYATFLHKSFYPEVQPQSDIYSSLYLTLGEIFLRFRNNCLNYSRLSLLLYKNGFNKLIAFLLLKRHIQNLSGVIISYKKRSPPKFKPLKIKGLSASRWEELCVSDEFKKIICLIADDIASLTVKYSELFKEIQMCAQNDNRLSYLRDKHELDKLFDINYGYNEENMVKYFAKFINDQNSKKMKDFTEIADLVNKVQIYELYNPDEMLK